MWPKVHTTLGGLKIDLQARVLNEENHPIQKLFAAGEVTGGIHGASRLGSCAITECLVMGRIAGQTAAK
jgi:succinate dehydrogenase/fumarate reductase flavoprotein subunit